VLGKIRCFGSSRRWRRTPRSKWDGRARQRDGLRQVRGAVKPPGHDPGLAVEGRFGAGRLAHRRRRIATSRADAPVRAHGLRGPVRWRPRDRLRRLDERLAERSAPAPLPYPRNCLLSHGFFTGSGTGRVAVSGDGVAPGLLTFFRPPQVTARCGGGRRSHTKLKMRYKVEDRWRRYPPPLVQLEVT
jgi:hypothetical protein